MVWVSFSLQIFTVLLNFWRFKFSVVWVLVWVSPFYGDGGGSRTVNRFVLDFTGWPRFGSVTVWGWNGSSGSCSRFRRFLCKRVFLCFSTVSQERTVPVPVSVRGKRFRRFRFRFRFREKTVPTVPVSSSGSVPEPPWFYSGNAFQHSGQLNKKGLFAWLLPKITLPQKECDKSCLAKTWWKKWQKR